MTAKRFGDYLGKELSYPMRHIMVKDLSEGHSIAQFFLAKRKAQRTTRNGDFYLELVLADRTGTIPARAWSEAAERYGDKFDEGEFVFVEGKTDTYRGSLQVIVNKIQRIQSYEQQEGEIPGFEPAILVPTSKQDPGQMWEQLQGLVKTITPPQLCQLTTGLLAANEQQFKRYPAAISYHHAYLGGLLEHTLEVAAGIAHFADFYPRLHRGLALAGAVLHDIGKVRELENPIAPQPSFNGRLIGHLLLGRDMVREAANEMDWQNKQLPELLEHIIVSHHGELEFGAAIVPKTAEAIAVYYFDNLSAKLNMVTTHIDRDTKPGEFTDRHKLLGRSFFKGGLTDQGAEPE
ncbi:MAG: HD domain-containing protein [Candidatus Bipolaricaulota bacterium]|nr:HD domain-containing protein [Candidatus Bipolaricaulota bacterium]